MNRPHDLPPDETDAAERAALVALMRQASPRTESGAKTRLNQALDAAWGRQQAASDRRARLRWAWLLVRAQMRLVHPALWMGTALVLALGTLVTLLVRTPTDGGVPLLAFLAPVVAAVGVGILYGDETDPPTELLHAVPVPVQAVMLARLALLFAFNLTLAVAGSAALVLLGDERALLPLIADWLAPMTLLSSLAFLCSVLINDRGLSSVIALLAWGALLLRHVRSDQLPTLFRWIPDLWQAELLPVVLISLALAGIAVWLAGRDLRWSQASS